jgi:hypothetical protein
MKPTPKNTHRIGQTDETTARVRPLERDHGEQIHKARTVDYFLRLGFERPPKDY